MLPETGPAVSQCYVLLNETIPAGMFVDLYQTDNRHRLGGPKVMYLDNPFVYNVTKISIKHMIFMAC